jgi:hypothetical protein
VLTGETCTAIVTLLDTHGDELYSSTKTYGPEYDGEQRITYAEDVAIFAAATELECTNAAEDESASATAASLLSVPGVAVIRITVGLAPWY